MAVRYIRKLNDGNWVVSNSKTGNTLRKASTQKEAILLAWSLKTTSSLMIKRSSGWSEMYRPVDVTRQIDMKNIPSIEPVDPINTGLIKNNEISVKKKSLDKTLLIRYLITITSLIIIVSLAMVIAWSIGKL